MVVIEPCTNAGHLSPNLQVLTTVVTLDKGSFPVKVVNLGKKDIWLESREVIGNIVEGEIVHQDVEERIKFKRISTWEEKLQ
jgi:hypothetical protein